MDQMDRKDAIRQKQNIAGLQNIIEPLDMKGIKLSTDTRDRLKPLLDDVNRNTNAFVRSAKAFANKVVESPGLRDKFSLDNRDRLTAEKIVSAKAEETKSSLSSTIDLLENLDSATEKRVSKELLDKAIKTQQAVNLTEEYLVHRNQTSLSELQGLSQGKAR